MPVPHNTLDTAPCCDPCCGIPLFLSKKNYPFSILSSLFSSGLQEVALFQILGRRALLLSKISDYCCFGGATSPLLRCQDDIISVCQLMFSTLRCVFSLRLSVCWDLVTTPHTVLTLPLFVHLWTADPGQSTVPCSSTLQGSWWYLEYLQFQVKIFRDLFVELFY